MTQEIRIRSGDGWIGLGPEEHFDVTSLATTPDGLIVAETEADFVQDLDLTFTIECP